MKAIRFVIRFYVLLAILLPQLTKAKNVFRIENPSHNLSILLFPDSVSQGYLYWVQIRDTQKNLHIDTLIWSGLLDRIKTNNQANQSDTLNVKWQGQQLIIEDDWNWDGLKDYGVQFALDSCAKPAYLIFSSRKEYQIDTDLTYLASEFCGFFSLDKADRSYRTHKNDYLGNPSITHWKFQANKLIRTKELLLLDNQCARVERHFLMDNQAITREEKKIILLPEIFENSLYRFDIQPDKKIELIIYHCPINVLGFAILDKNKNVLESYPTLGIEAGIDQKFRYNDKNKTLFFVLEGEQYSIREIKDENNEVSFQLEILKHGHKKIQPLIPQEENKSLEELLIEYYDNLEITE